MSRFNASDFPVGRDVIGEYLSALFNPSQDHSFSLKGKFVDENEYDIIPKRGKIEKDLKFKEEDLRRLIQERDNDMKFYETNIQALKLTIDQLRQKLTP